MGTTKPDCKTCIFRAKENSLHRCDYASVTGHTRKAQDPEKCTYYRKGKRIEQGEYRLLEEVLNAPKQKRAKGAGKKPVYDWEKAMKLYRQGKNDGQISRVLGCGPSAVYGWRKQRKLPANAKAGRNRRSEL